MRNPGVLLPWLVAEAIFTYRTVRNRRRAPFPGELLGLSGLFVLLAVLEGPAPQLARLIGWGIDIAAILNLFDKAAPGSTLGTAIAGPGPKTSTGGAGAHPSGNTATPGGTRTI